MKDFETLVTDITEEEKALRDKINRLESFMMTEDFLKINSRQKLLLTQQLDAMNNYKDCLICRVLQLRLDHELEEKKACDIESEKADATEHNCSTCKYNNGPHTCSKLGKDIAAARPGDFSCWEKKEPDCNTCKHNGSELCERRRSTPEWGNCWEAK